MNNTFVIRIVGLAGGRPDPMAGLFVKDYSPDEGNGRGHLIVTPDVADAFVFTDPVHAIERWQAVSRTHPVRADGHPNRPLTAYTVEILRRRDLGN